MRSESLEVVKSVIPADRQEGVDPNRQHEAAISRIIAFDELMVRRQEIRRMTSDE